MHDRRRIDMQWLVIGLIMLVGGMVFFGWRGLINVGLTVASCHLTYFAIARLRQRGRAEHGQHSQAYGLWMGLLMGVSTPLSLNLVVPIISGLLLGLAMHIMGRAHRLRIHPIAPVILLVWILPSLIYLADAPTMRQSLTQPVQTVLRPGRVFIGDAADAGPTTNWVDTLPWLDVTGPTDSLRRKHQQTLLIREQRRILDDPNLLINMLRSGELVPLEELLFGAVPGPIGATSPLLLILLGLYLMYNRLASWRSAVAALAGALATYLLMPIAHDGDTTTVFARLLSMQPAAAITLVSYVLLASPWCLIVLILAPGVDPLSRKGRFVYGLIIGAIVMLCQWYTATPETAFSSLVVAGLISRPLDALARSPFTTK